MPDYKNTRSALLLCAAILVLPGRALGAEQSAITQTDNTLEEVVVTGAVPRNADVTNARPITVVGEDAIASQTFVPNIYQAVQGDFRTATQSVYRSRTQASYVSLPVNSR